MTDIQLSDITDIDQIIDKMTEYAKCGLAHNGRPTDIAYEWGETLKKRLKDTKSTAALLKALKDRRCSYYERNVPHVESIGPESCMCRKCIDDRGTAAITKAEGGK